MATTNNSGSRSLHGCWTCRLRKKKCDEARPTCTTCTRLGLHCHGFGSRPVWMDRGVLQREKALEVKRILKNSNPGRPLHPPVSTAEHNELQADAVPDDEASLGGSHEPRHDDHVWDDRSYSDVGLGEGFDRGDAISLFNPGPVDGTAGSSRMNYQLPPDLDDILDTNGRPQSTISPQNGGPSNESAHKSLHIPLSLLRKTASSDGATTWQYNSGSWPSDTRESILGGGMQDMLFVHYVDEIFPIQYPSSHTPEMGKGWLFCFLRRDKSAYHATLALSGYHRYLTLPGHDNSTKSHLLQVANHHYDVAFQEMQSSLEQASRWTRSIILDRSVRTLLCIHQLLHWESLHGGTENWQIHLQVASTLLPALVRHLETSTAAQRTTGSDTQRENPLHPEYDSISRFLLSSFLSMDILSSVSTRSRLLLDLDHKCLLERRNIYMEDFGGRRKWVLILMLDILQLDLWKREASNNQTLSILDLVRRGSVIEKRLSDELNNMGDHTSLTDIIGHPFGIPASTEITRIFALAARTYLHVVISGAHPKLPEYV